MVVRINARKLWLFGMLAIVCSTLVAADKTISVKTNDVVVAKDDSALYDAPRRLEDAEKNDDGKKEETEEKSEQENPAAKEDAEEKTNEKTPTAEKTDEKGEEPSDGGKGEAPKAKPESAAPNDAAPAGDSKPETTTAPTKSPTPAAPEKEPTAAAAETPIDDEEGNGGFLFFLLVLGIALAIGGIKNKQKILAAVETFKATMNDEGGSAQVGKNTKYEQVASDEGDEEWGWGDDSEKNNNITNGNSNDDFEDDWGNDDWGDDSNNDIEMTMATPSFASSTKSYNDVNMHQRRPSLDDDDKKEPPVRSPRTTSASSFHSKSTSGGSSTSTGISLNKPKRMNPVAPTSGGSSISDGSSPMAPPPSSGSLRLATPLSQQQELPGTIGGMSMGITSLGPKKTAKVAPKPKKKTLIGATDDDIFASMGFGGPPPPKPAPKKSPAKLPSSTNTPSRWATPADASSTFNAPAPRPTTATKPSGMSSATTPMTIPAPTPAPAPSIPDGFGDDLDLDLNDDVAGGDGGGDDNWGDDDGDLDDLLFD